MATLPRILDPPAMQGTGDKLSSALATTGLQRGLGRVPIHVSATEPSVFLTAIIPAASSNFRDPTSDASQLRKLDERRAQHRVTVGNVSKQTTRRLRGLTWRRVRTPADEGSGSFPAIWWCQLPVAGSLLARDSPARMFWVAAARSHRATRRRR
jgi:hypothetical protein